MLKALRCKFNDNPELKKKLLATGNKRLIEHTHNDSYWGDGGDGRGKNKLGKLLERVRSELQSPPRDARDLDLNSLTSKAEMVPMDSSSHQSPLRRSSSFSGSTRHIPSVATAQRTGEWNHYSNDNPELKKKLLATGNKRLIEHTHNNSYWGDGGDGRGKNKLGKLLERVRSELQSPPRDARDLDLKSLTISESKAEMVPMDSSSHQSPLRRSSSFSGSTTHKPSVAATTQRTGEWSHYSCTSRSNGSTGGSEQQVIPSSAQPHRDKIDIATRDLKSNHLFLSQDHCHVGFAVDSLCPSMSLLGTSSLARTENQQPSVPADGDICSSLKRSYSFSPFSGHKTHYTYSSTVEPSNSVQKIALVSRENLPTETPKHVSSAQSRASSKGNRITTSEPLHANTRSSSSVLRTGTENQRAAFPTSAPSHCSLHRSSSLSRLHSNASSRTTDSSNLLQGTSTRQQPLSAVSNSAHFHRPLTRSYSFTTCDSQRGSTTGHIPDHLEKREHSRGSKNPPLEAPKSHQNASLRSSSASLANHQPPVIKNVQNQSKDHSSHRARSSLLSTIKSALPSLTKRKRTDANHDGLDILTWLPSPLRSKK